MADFFVNGAFAGQRITGQQRYAHEVSRRLVSEHGARMLVPPPPLVQRPALAHAWAHVALPIRSRTGPLVSMTARSPVVARQHTLVVHDLFVLEHPEWYSAAYVRTHAPVLSAQLRTAARLIAVSEPVAQKLRRMHPGKSVTVGPNAPSDVFHSPTGEQLPDVVRGMLDEPGVQGFIFAVGSRDPRKNFGRLAAAYALLPAAIRSGFPLVIAGGESVVFAPDLGPLVSDVRWLGYVDDPALADLYGAASLVVVPSLDEGFGLPVVEALTAGGRLAVSDIPTFRWVAGDSALFFDPEDVDDLARALLDAVEEPPAVGDPAEVSSRFSWTRTADVIASVASQPRA